MIAGVDELEHEGGYPAVQTLQKLYDQLDLQRAAQAYLDFIPAKDIWSVTVYDAETRSLLQNGREKNWVETVPGRGWFTNLRLYGPLEPFFEQTWKPHDIVRA